MDASITSSRMERTVASGLPVLVGTSSPDCASASGDAQAMLGEDFWPYGVEPNRPTLEAYLQYAFEQGVSRRRLAVEELFAPETLSSYRI